ncbi:MAG TPA: phosphatidylglycerophosphatase A [Blastocatellia bacterium]|nr:phosphatidylglycerophosphatase A [Blastocatellia bacterium]
MIDRKFQESQAKRGRVMRLNGATDYVALFLATGFGSGLIPLGPGTCGSLVGLLIAYGLLSAWSFDALLIQNCFIVVSILLAAAGIWSGTRAEKIFDRKDAGQIVMDEVCGQVLSFVLVAPNLSATTPGRNWWLVAGFALFRIFDIFKPYPIGQLQSLTGGLGVMIDDIVAGIYAAVILSLAFWIVTA